MMHQGRLLAYGLGLVASIVLCEVFASEYILNPSSVIFVFMAAIFGLSAVWSGYHYFHFRKQIIPRCSWPTPTFVRWGMYVGLGAVFLSVVGLIILIPMYLSAPSFSVEYSLFFGGLTGVTGLLVFYQNWRKSMNLIARRFSAVSNS